MEKCMQEHRGINQLKSISIHSYFSLHMTVIGLVLAFLFTSIYSPLHMFIHSITSNISRTKDNRG